jgi:molybdopterin converting factor small subunit
MKVNFFATLRQITGQKTVEFDLPDYITAQAGARRGDRALSGDDRRDLLDENGHLHRHCHMFINGRGVTVFAG